MMRRDFFFEHHSKASTHGRNESLKNPAGAGDPHLILSPNNSSPYCNSQ